MNIAVVGAGVAGVATALELALDGHQVTVFERAPGVAEGGSFAHSGLLSAACLLGLARAPAPGLRGRAAFDPRARIAPTGWLSRDLMRWQWQRWHAGRGPRHVTAVTALHRLAGVSRDRLTSLTRVLKLDCEQRRGVTVLLRDGAEVARHKAAEAALEDAGIRFEWLDRQAVLASEPGLSRDAPLAAGMRLPDDGCANARRFAQLLRNEAQRLGARFLFGAEVLSLQPGPAPRLRWHQPGDGPATEWHDDDYDAVVLCAAVSARDLLRPLGLRLPVAVLRGHSITAPLRHRNDDDVEGPMSAVFDAAHGVVISRLGRRIRMCGRPEATGFGSAPSERSMDTLYRVQNLWFPGAAQLAQVQRWHGACPALPDGLPLVGATPVAGLWVNTGHAQAGFTLACGSARLLADQIGGRPPALAAEPFAWDRLVRG